MLARLAVIVAALFALALPASAKPPLEAYGDVPEIRAMDMSPDGKQLAYLGRYNGADYLFLYDLATQKQRTLAPIENIKARAVRFVSDTYIVLIASETIGKFGYRGRRERSAAFAYDLKTNKISVLLNKTEDLFPGQISLGVIIGVDPDARHVYMPAYLATIDAQELSVGVFRVDLATGKGAVKVKGPDNTTDWIIDPKGNAIAREEFDRQKRVHRVRAYGQGGIRTIYEKTTDLPEISPVGVSSVDGSLIAASDNDSDFISLYSMNPNDGSLGTPLFERANAEVEGLVQDDNRVIYGVRYSGMTPSYALFDKALQDDIVWAQGQFGGASVYVTSWSKDWSKVLLLVDGGSGTERYVVFQRTPRQLTLAGDGRPAIKLEDIAQVFTIEYKARDGLKIPALVTWPVGVPESERKKLPFVVLPHGGPESYDSIRFDWLAQFLANEGYAVLQPNFRGSGGFGASFAAAGHGEWGRKMQSDITDGADAMVKTGWADPNRMCILGWSYGGYAALAGGALTPDKYKCVVSVAGVSDLRAMLESEKRLRGENSMTLTYWKKLIGDPDTQAQAIDAVSPAKLAANFTAPVLLIHGTDDTTVPPRQSDLMNDALKDARKPVNYIQIKGDDHSLAKNDSRRTALTAISEFLAKYLK